MSHVCDLALNPAIVGFCTKCGAIFFISGGNCPENYQKIYTFPELLGMDY
jgi:hypothetical protein